MPVVRRVSWLWGLIAIMVVHSAATGQPLRKQLRNTDSPSSMTPEELAELGDPLFELVLRNHADALALPEVERLLQPQASNRQLFVVGEETVDGNPSLVHRAVLAFRGTNNGFALSPNVMLSVTFTGDVFPSDPTAPSAPLPFVEAWGWDANRGRYNYYRMDKAGGDHSWKFRGSSEGADLFTAAQRKQTCFECHISGAPIMKELSIPWNHWHSEVFSIRQLDPLQPATVRWKVATEARFISASGTGGLTSAAQLELAIRESLKAFNESRLTRRLTIDSNGTSFKVTEGRRLLRPLFETVEFNIVSSRVFSNMHPLSTTPPTQPTQPIEVPASFFLNSEFIAGGGQSGLRGLGLDGAFRFPGPGVAVFQPAEYRARVEHAHLKIRGESGDANFAWLSPEPSNIDNQMSDALIERGVVPGQFAAAVMAIDLRVPLLSTKRKQLLAFVPSTFAIGQSPPADPHDVDFFRGHELTKATVQALEATAPVAGSTELEFLKLLRMDEGPPRDVLMNRVQDYSAEIRSALEDPTKRDAKLSELFEQLIRVREAVLEDESLGPLDETGGTLLFPAHE